MLILNTTPIILFIKEIKYLHFFELCNKFSSDVYITTTVYEEFKGDHKKQLDSLIDKKFIKLLDTKNTEEFKSIKIRFPGLGDGEASVVAASIIHKKKEHLIILDDQRACKNAKKLGLNTTGTVGLLLKLYEAKLLDREELKKIAKKINESPFYINFEVLGLKWLLE